MLETALNLVITKDIAFRRVTIEDCYWIFGNKSAFGQLFMREATL